MNQEPVQFRVIWTSLYGSRPDDFDQVMSMPLMPREREHLEINGQFYVVSAVLYSTLEDYPLVFVQKAPFPFEKPLQDKRDRHQARQCAYLDFNLKELSIPPTVWRNKIYMIKAIREVTGLGLRDLKDIVESQGLFTVIGEENAKCIREFLEGRVTFAQFLENLP